ncbi:MAG: acpS [Chthoniobacteraceae bacterium]|nr:acpS [Chthoniobacteraceae bacterium]
MKIVGIGIDIVETVRIAASIERHGGHFLDRVFTKDEQEYCDRMRIPFPNYAARFAAKEAVSKAFGTGIGDGISWLDIEVQRKASGEPFIVLHAGAADLAQRLGISTVMLTLSHSDHYAVANAIALA